MVHPFHPPGLPINDYVENNQTILQLLGKFAALSVFVVLLIRSIARRYRPGLSVADEATIVWFAFSGCLHVGFEGYFVANYDRMPSRLDLFGQLWKEYSLSDSRYMSEDGFVVSIEAMTVAVLGPLCFASAYLTLIRSPYRHSVQMLVSTCHIYGDCLYYATSTFHQLTVGASYSRPERYYFWLYYVGMNFIWILVPSLILLKNVSAVATVMYLKEKAATKPKIF